MTPSLLIWFTALFLGLQPISSDLYLPALPTLTKALGASMAQAQLTLSAMLLSFGVSQLVWGPMSDRFGRRPILLAGLSLYTLAALASSGVGTMEQLIAWRAMQGAALGAVVMCARAMARDVYEPQEAARLMSKGLSGLGVIALFAVPLGSLATEWGGWRWALALPGVFSAAVLILMSMKFVETNQRKNPQALQWRELLRTWRMILWHRQFWAYAMLSLVSYAGLFIFLATSSFVYLQMLGKSKAFYSIVIMMISGVYILSTFLARRVLAKRGVTGMVRLGGFVSLGAGLLYVGLYALGERSAWALIVPQLVYMLGHGFHQPAGQAGAAAAFPQAAGAASAMAGFLMMCSAFVIGLLLGQVMDGSARPMVFGIALSSVALALVAWTWVQKYGQLR